MTAEHEHGRVPAPSFLVCRPVDELAEAPGATQRDCYQCGSRVWVVPANLVLGAPIVCRRCYPALLKAALAEHGGAILVPAKPFAEARRRIESN